MFSRLTRAALSNLIASRLELNKSIKLGNFKRFESSTFEKKWYFIIFLVILPQA